MKIGKWLKWSLVVVPLVLVAVGAVLYMMANATPKAYQPQVLSAEQVQEVRQTMQRKITAMLDLSAIDEGGIEGIENVQVRTIERVDPDTGRKITVRQTTFDMNLAEDEFNQWISAMSEQSLEKLATSGITQPAISISDKGVTLYAHIRKFDKVVGMNMGFRFAADGTCTFKIKPASVGNLPLPAESVEQYRAKVVAKARKDVASVAAAAKNMFEGETGELAASVVKGMGSAVGDAIAGKPVRIQFVQNGSRVQVRGVKTVGGRLTLDMVSEKDLTPPALAAPAAPAAPAAAQAAAPQAVQEQAKARRLTPEDMQAAELNAEQDQKVRNMAAMGY